VSQPVETQAKRRGHLVAAGVMTIVSASLLIVLHLALMYSYSMIKIGYVFWLYLPSEAIAIMFDVLALLGGALALTRTHLLFAVFGASVLIPASSGYVAIVLGSLMMRAENLVLPVYAILFIIISPVALVLATLSLILLAKSKSEFS
jgi:hypothetical protein